MPNTLIPDAVTRKVMVAGKPLGLVGKSGAKGIDERPGQRNAGDGDDQGFGKAREQQHDRGAEDRKHPVTQRIDRSAKPAFFSIRMRIRPGADRCCDRGKIGGVGTKSGCNERRKPGDGEDRLGRRLITRCPQHRKARQILRRHGHQIKRQTNPIKVAPSNTGEIQTNRENAIPENGSVSPSA